MSKLRTEGRAGVVRERIAIVGCGKPLQGEFDIVYYPVGPEPGYITWRKGRHSNENFPHEEYCGKDAAGCRFCVECAQRAGVIW